MVIMYHFDSFLVERLPKKVSKLIDHKNMTNIYWLQAYDSITHGYFCIRFIDFMFEGKWLIYFTNLFSPSNFRDNDKVILNNFLNWNKYKNDWNTYSYIMNMYPQLDNAMQISLDKINEIKDYFIDEIFERETMNKRFSKYVAAFDRLIFIPIVLLWL